MVKTKLKKVTFRLNEDQVQKLEDIRNRKYPKAEDRTMVIRWLIEDVWEEMRKEVGG
jgi:hypothetical protein